MDPSTLYFKTEPQKLGMFHSSRKPPWLEYRTTQRERDSTPSLRRVFLGNGNPGRWEDRARGKGHLPLAESPKRKLQASIQMMTEGHVPQRT